MPYECLCVYDSRFVLDLIVILLHLLVGWLPEKIRELSRFAKWSSENNVLKQFDLNGSRRPT